MRLRREAARRALRIARLVQVALVVAAVAASIALLVPKGTTIDLPAALASIRWVAVPIFAIGALLIMAPVAVYFVVTEE